MMSGLDDDAVRNVLAASAVSSANDGEVVFVQGEPSDTLFMVLEGRLKISQLTDSGSQTVVRYLGPGEMAGCVAMGGLTHYPATASAVGASRVLRWSRRTLGELVERFPRLALNSLATISFRMEELQARFAELASERVEQRIARTVLRLIVQAGERVEGGIRIAIPLSRQDLADMTGTTLHTVSRTLSAWQDAGLVQIGRQQVTVVAVDGVAMIGNGGR